MIILVMGELSIFVGIQFHDFTQFVNFAQKYVFYSILRH